MNRFRWVAIAVIVCACLFVDYRILSESYGAGPPYYGRTVNMDKWTSPAPELAVVHGIGLGAIAVVMIVTRRATKRL